MYNISNNHSTWMKKDFDQTTELQPKYAYENTHTSSRYNETNAYDRTIKQSRQLLCKPIGYNCKAS